MSIQSVPIESMLVQDFIKTKIYSVLRRSLEGLELDEQTINAELDKLKIEAAKSVEYGDYSTTAPLVFNKLLKKPPVQLAEQIKAAIENDLAEICSVEILPPGFINFRLTEKAHQINVKHLLNGELVSKKQRSGKLMIEYVSANPTGDLHLGHGRGAVVGSALAEIIRATGREVLTEFYINDAGEQIQKLGKSAWNIYKNQPSEPGDYPPELLKDYVIDIAEGLNLEQLTEEVKNRILNKQKFVLERINVKFDKWTSEKEDLHQKGALEQAIQKLKNLNLTYEKEGALWLKSSELGDERDRVLIKSENKKPTYLAGDIAYHLDKFERADELLDIFGADHQGQEISLKVALKAFDKDSDKFHILFIQFVSLQENGEEVKMSKRNGSVITVEEVVEKTGADAFRFTLLVSHINNRMVFDVDLATKADDQNPVFYVQYAHARACSIIRNALQPHAETKETICTSEELEKAIQEGNILLALEKNELEDKEILATKELIKKLSFFSNEVHRSAESMNPSSIAYYLMDLATLFHSFYSHCRAINYSKKGLSMARLLIIKAFQRVLQRGLSLLLVSAPERM
ncbi:MAG: arginine--tRNA ligase [Candidatus Caenarcaniphilales bacterium]|nr:arginine--tRNA ligase [Candidatus Caenarcaniphilales bacterium]